MTMRQKPIAIATLWYARHRVGGPLDSPAGRRSGAVWTSLRPVEARASRRAAPAQITDPGICKREPRCREAVDIFCAMLGTVAGNLALTLGAPGGICVAGGIVPKLGAVFAASAFR